MSKRMLVLAALLLLAGTVQAQNTDIEALAGIQFNFANPGARSLGMGGAFLGLADDASAAEANPAGLTILRKPEFSVEARNFEVTQNINVTGTFPDMVSHEFSSFSRRAEVSFASAVLPMKDFAIAAYYHEPLQYANSAAVLPIFNSRGDLIQQVPNFYLPETGAPVTLQQCLDIIKADPTNEKACQEYRILPFQTAVDITVKTYGVAAAWKLSTFSVGLAAKYQKLSEGAFTYREDFQGNPSSIAVQATGSLKNGELVLKDQNDVTWTAGFKWSLAPSLSIGGVYKTGGKFDAPVFLQTSGNDFAKLADTKFHVPDVMGLGVSWRPMQSLTLNADGVRIKYSNLTDQFQSVNLDVRNAGNPFSAEDVTEIHAGAEYFFSTKIPIAVRGGWWRDPAHAVKYTGPLTGSQLVASAILFPASEDQDHWSIGAGVAFPSFEVNAGYDTSDRYKVGSLTAVFRF